MVKDDKKYTSECGIRSSTYTIDIAKNYINTTSALTKDAHGKLLYSRYKISDKEVKTIAEARRTTDFNKALRNSIDGKEIDVNYEHADVVRKLAGNYTDVVDDQHGDMVRNGLNVSKLHGRIGQYHNSDKVMIDKEGWVDAHMDGLDFSSVESVHPHLAKVEGETDADLYNKRRNYLEATAEEIIDTRDGSFLGGSNISLEHIHNRRVFRYKDHAKQTAINERFGSGGSDVLTQMINTIENTAQTTAIAQTFGVKPQIMADAMKKELTMEKNIFLDQMNDGGFTIGKASKDAIRSFSKQAKEIAVAHNFINEVLTGEASTERLHGINKSIQSARQFSMSVALKNLFKWAFTEPAQLVYAENKFGLDGGKNYFINLIEKYGTFLESLFSQEMQLAELGIGFDGVLERELGASLTAELAQMGIIVELDNIGFSKIQMKDGKEFGWVDGFSRGVQKATGATFLFERTSRNAAINFQSHLKQQLKNSWGELPEKYRELLMNSGITEGEWVLLQKFVEEYSTGSTQYVMPDQIGLNLAHEYVSPNVVAIAAKNNLTATARDAMLSIARKLQIAQTKYHGTAVSKSVPLVTKIMRQNLGTTSANQFIGGITEAVYAASEFLHGWSHNHRFQTNMGSEGDMNSAIKYVAMMFLPTMFMIMFTRALKGEKPELTVDYMASLMLDTSLATTGNYYLAFALEMARDLGVQDKQMTNTIIGTGAKLMPPEAMLPIRVLDKINKIRKSEDIAEGMYYANELRAMFTPDMFEVFIGRVITDNILSMIDSDGAHAAFLLMKQDDIRKNVSRWIEPGAWTPSGLSKYELELIEQERKYRNE